MQSETRTICPYCGVGCGLVARSESGRLQAVRGDDDYPVNRGRTCRKPLELPASVHAADRATTPLVRDSRAQRFLEASWDDAIGGVAEKLEAIVAEHGPDAIAFYISGQLLSEDYYVVNKLVKGFIGTNNVDSNSRLCMSSAVAGYHGAFGSDGPPPSYEDIERADCFFLLGTNTAACHPIVWARIRDRQEVGAFVICADPRETPTASGADLHLSVRPGTDLALLNAMLHVVVRDELVDTAFVEAHTSGWAETAAVAAEWSPSRAAEVCDVPANLIEEAARRFASAPAALALWSMGANQSTVGTAKNRALINLCLATGQIGRPGAGPLSLTGQPNAMGGRETGGLAHLLPGYRSVSSHEDRDALERYWNLHAGAISPRPGLPAVELFDALDAGTVKAVWIVATNPLVSMPDSGRARRALERAELVVCQDAYHPTETSALAHVVLPAAAWPEKTGTMTNSERRVGLVEAALPPPGDAQPDWRIFAALARTLGHGASFAWESEAEVFAEFAAITEGRVCDLSGITYARLGQERGIQWPCPREGSAAPARLYPDHRYPTDDGRARFAATPHRPPSEVADSVFPLVLTTGRVADHWHTMTRTGKSFELRAASPEPFVELHPDDAADAGVCDGELTRIISRRGSASMRAAVRAGIPRGVAFAPFHWGALHTPPGAGGLNETSHGARDEISGQPELKALAVRVEPAAARRVRRPTGERVVVIGGGMAGLAAVEELRARERRSRRYVTLLAEEAQPSYNRVQLSRVLACTSDPSELVLRGVDWYRENAIDLSVSCAARTVDVQAQVVVDARGREHRYDRLVLATGSRPTELPIAGIEQPHVFAFRTIRDAERIAALARRKRYAVVVGGGLLGLEAAAGLLVHGVHVTVIEHAERLMPAQLDGGGAAMLLRSLAQLDLDIITGSSVSSINRRRVRLHDGREVPADIVVVAAGVRPETTLAQDAGIEVKRGIVVDDAMRTSADHVFAAGECAEHCGTVYGLWAPVAEQARTAAAGVVGDPAAFHGSAAATTLKIAGVNLYAGGAHTAAGAQDEIVWSDGPRRIYRKLILDGQRLAGAVMVGDISLAPELSALLRTGAPCPRSLLEPSAGPRNDLDESAILCACNGVTHGEIVKAIRRGSRTRADVARATRASTGCGSCGGDVDRLLTAAGT